VAAVAPAWSSDRFVVGRVIGTVVSGDEAGYWIIRWLRSTKEFGTYRSYLIESAPHRGDWHLHVTNESPECIICCFKLRASSRVPKLAKEHILQQFEMEEDEDEKHAVPSSAASQSHQRKRAREQPSGSSSSSSSSGAPAHARPSPVKARPAPRGDGRAPEPAARDEAAESACKRRRIEEESG
jgi:hypothetical protein